MQIEDNLYVPKAEFQRPVEPLKPNEEVEKLNPDVPRNIQTQILKDATQTPSSPTQQGVQVLATVQAGANLQSTAQQQIRNGYLDIKI